MVGQPDMGTDPTVLQSGDHGGRSDRLAPGAAAGEYVIDRYLGGGGMGEVYAGHHPVIGKKVAVKVIRSQLATSPEAVARFTREARAVNQVDHANVVDVFALGRLDDGRLFLVMDLVEGDSLRARIGRGRLAPGEALAVLEPIAVALDAAHARGVVHRDLKPDNVMVSGAADRPTVKVLDFGIAKLVSSVATDDARAVVATATLTGQGTWLGTPTYMAPEQWSSDGAVPASDRYALAAMAYELLAGEPPFTAASVPALMEKHFRAEVPTVTGRGANLPAAVDAVLRRGLAKDPDARFATAAELIAALREALGTQLGTAAAPAAAAKLTTGGRRPAALPLVAGGAGLAVTAIGVWIVTHDRGAAPRAGADPAIAGPTAEVLSTPPGATIVAGDKELGVTPHRIELPGGREVAVELRKPGYLPQKRTVGAGTVVEVALQPVDGFQGTWALPDGELRRFVRQGDAVVALRLAAASDNGTYYRRFQFVPSTGATVSFAAEEEHVDPRAPDEPTCHVPLTAEYDYDVGGDELELKKERVKLDLVNGKCVVVDQGWGEPQALARIDRASDTGDWAESRAGGAVPVANPGEPAVVDNPGFQPKEPLADEGQAATEPVPPPNLDKPSKPPGKAPTRPSTKPRPRQPTAAELKKQEQLDLEQLKKAGSSSANNPPTGGKGKAQPSGGKDAPIQGTLVKPTPQQAPQQAVPQSQIAPQPQANSPPDNTEGAIQQAPQKK